MIVSIYNNSSIYNKMPRAHILQMNMSPRHLLTFVLDIGLIFDYLALVYLLNL